MGKSEDFFESIMKRTNRLGTNHYQATTAKRITVVLPKGVTVFDTDQNKNYIGDGATYGGRSEVNKITVRKIDCSAATSAGITASATTDYITWPTVGATLRTGDAVIAASGTTGIMPSGLNGASGTYYVVKDSFNPTSTSFKVATTRAKAVSGVPDTVDLLTSAPSGVSGFNLSISSVAVDGGEDILMIDPLAVTAVEVLLPYPSTANAGRRITVKRAAASGTDTTVTIKGLTSGNAVAVSGAVIVDDAAGYVTLTSGAIMSGKTFILDGVANEYITM